MTKKDSIVRLARIHPLTTVEIQQIAGLPTHNAASVLANSLVKQNRLQPVGMLKTANGRPLTVYCSSWIPKRDTIRHEYLLTKFCLLYETAKFLRGYKVNRKIEPDAEMTLGGHSYMIEMDCGTMPKERVSRRWKKYREYQDTLLVVCASNPLKGIDSEERLVEIMLWSQSVAEVACFTTLERVLADPYGRVWEEIGGAQKALKKPAKLPTHHGAHLLETDLSQTLE